MKAAFLEGQDIHASTAMRVFGIEKAEDVTPNMRRQAKAVNFGIVYGISDYGLSQNLGISRKAAQQYIDTYFEKYPGVKEYMERIVREAKTKATSKRCITAVDICQTSIQEITISVLLRNEQLSIHQSKEVLLIF